MEPCWCYFLFSDQSGCVLDFALQRNEACHAHWTWEKKFYFTCIMSYSFQGMLCQQKSSISDQHLMLLLSALCTEFPLKHTQTRKDAKSTEISVTQNTTKVMCFSSLGFFTCLWGCSDWLVKVTRRFSPVRGLSKTKSRTGLRLSKEDCGRSNISWSVSLSMSSATCTDGENKTRNVGGKGMNSKWLWRTCLPPAMCKSCCPFLCFLLVSLTSFNNSDPDG